MTRATTIDTRRTFTIADLNTEIDDEPRILDVKLGEGLGFSRPRAIRQIIERNLAELDTYGTSATRRGAYRGQPFTEYFLNEGQALLICMFAKTAKAAAVRKALIDVFMEYRRGRIEKPISVRGHSRRTSTKIDDAIRLRANIDRLEAVADKIQPQAPNMCAMVIDGEPVFVDVNKYDGDGRAVVIEHDGRIRIQNVEQERSGFKPLGVRSALGERYPSPHGYGGTCRNTVAVIGMVIGQQAPGAALPTPQMQIEHEPVRRIVKTIPKAPYRDKILALLGTGLSKRQIAEKVGCSIHGVDYWHRKVSAR